MSHPESTMQHEKGRMERMNSHIASMSQLSLLPLSTALECVSLLDVTLCPAALRPSIPYLFSSLPYALFPPCSVVIGHALLPYHRHPRRCPNQFSWDTYIFVLFSLHLVTTCHSCCRPFLLKMSQWTGNVRRDFCECEIETSVSYTTRGTESSHMMKRARRSYTMRKRPAGYR